MSLDILNIVDIIEIMENHVAKIRPQEHLREKFDITYKIENQSVIIQEVRPTFQHPEKKTEIGYAKATYIKNTGKWKVYWMRASLKWSIFDPQPEVSNLREFVELVERDSYRCFKG
jgi:hypothetical protein